MIEGRTMQRRRHRYWPFHRYTGCWWQHPYCQLPPLKWMGKPTEEEIADLNDGYNTLDKVIRFAARLKKN